MPSPQTDPHIGSYFGNFRIVRKLGEGGMGVVYEAENPKISSRAAVKLLHARFAQDGEYAKRFLNEARSVNVIRHRGLVEISDFGQLPDGTLYYVMELLKGDSLRKRIDAKKGPFPVEEAIAIGAQVARALSAAHKAGIVHRDLKPDNLMLEVDPVNAGQDWVKILDFGIAKFRAGRDAQADTDKTNVNTQYGSFMGTQLYMPPEQHGRAEDVDGRADVFSLGVVLYELLTGTVPFEQSSLSLLVRTPMPIAKLNPAVSTKLSKLVDQMMAARRDDRPTMDVVASRLDAMLSSHVRTGRRLVALAGVIGVLVGALLIGVLRMDRAQSPAELRIRSHNVLSETLQGQDSALQLQAIQVIGQSRDLEQRSLIEPLLKDSQKWNQFTPKLRESLVRALGQIGALDTTPIILPLLSRSEPIQMQLAAADALSQMQHPRGQEALRELLVDGDLLTKIEAALRLVSYRDAMGADLLWKSVDTSGLSLDKRLEVLGKLARSDDERAKQRLWEELSQLSRLPLRELRVRVALWLAQCGDDRAWPELRNAANQKELMFEQLLALRFLAALGEPDSDVKLREVMLDRKQPDSLREQAVEGLADGNNSGSLDALGVVLEDRGTSPRLRIAVAGAILRITAGELAKMGEHSLAAARGALGSDSQSMRELAISMLSQVDSEQAVGLLGQALSDKERVIRLSAAKALGRKNLRGAVIALRPALRDADSEVRSLAIRSLGQVVQTLGKRADGAIVGSVIQDLRQMSSTGSESEKLVASGVLLQLGQARVGELAVLRNGLGAKDAELRRLAIEVGDVDRSQLVSALEDADPSVRLAAAYRLAKQGLSDGASVLRAVVESGSKEALQAFLSLRVLGEQVAAPPGLLSLLTSGDLATRLSVLDAVRELSSQTELQLKLVKTAMLDPVSVIRRRAAEVAAQLFKKDPQLRYLRLVRSLRNDPDVSVRAQVVVLLQDLAAITPVNTELVPTPTLAPVSPSSGSAEASKRDGEVASPAASPTASPAVATGMGDLLVEGEELVRFQIDKGAMQLITGRAIQVAIGKHRIGYLRGQQDVTILAGQVTKIRIPVTLAEQMVQDARAALDRKDLIHGQESLDQLRRMIQRGKAPQSMQADLSFQQARLHESRDQLDLALMEYNRVLNIPAGQRRAELNAALQATQGRLSSKVSRIQVFTLVDGQCVITREIWSSPGQQQISIGKGQTRSIYATLGSINKVMACQ